MNVLHQNQMHWSWEAHWLEHQHVTLEIQVQAPVQDRLLLSSDIRSEGSIAIVKKFDFDFFMIFGSTSLPQSKNVF